MTRTARILETDNRGKVEDEGCTCELVLKPLLVVRYFAQEQAELDVLQAEVEATTACIHAHLMRMGVSP